MVKKLSALVTLVGFCVLLVSSEKNEANNKISVVDESLFLGEDASSMAWVARLYTLPQDKAKQFIKFELNADIIDINSSLIAVARETTLNSASNSWFGDIFSFVPNWGISDSVARILVKKDEKTGATICVIEPHKGFVAFVTADEPKLGVDAETYSKEVEKGVDPKTEKIILETVVAREYTLDFYPEGRCIKTSRPTYGKRAGSVKIGLRSGHTGSSVGINTTVVQTAPDGSKSSKKTEIQYPTLFDCARGGFQSSSRGSFETKEAYQLRYKEVTKCLRTPKVFKVDEKKS